MHKLLNNSELKILGYFPRISDHKNYAFIPFGCKMDKKRINLSSFIYLFKNKF